MMTGYGANIGLYGFGFYLRAKRMGYGYCEPVDAWVRISESGLSNKWYVEVVREFKDLDKLREKFICWWEDDPMGKMLYEKCWDLRLMKPPSYCIVDDMGRIVNKIHGEEE